MIFHIDANSFYASCERLFRPDLYGRPIAVLSNNDGITIALNQECKNLGFKRGDTFFKMRAQYEAAGVAMFSSNYTLYADISRRLNLLYAQYAQSLEQYSIDESFLFFSDWKNNCCDSTCSAQSGHGVSSGVFDYYSLACEIRNETLRQIHMPVSIGIAPTKTLAKMCNKLAKHSGGVCDWNTVDHEKILSAYPVSEVWGIGASKASSLSLHGVRTALDLARFPLDKAKKELTIAGFNTVRELNGIPCIEHHSVERRQNITTSRSFAHGVTSFAELETAVAEYTQLAVERLRREHSVCGIISVCIMTARAFCPQDKEKEYFNSDLHPFENATDSLPELTSAAVGLLHSLYRREFEYRKVMVNLLALESGSLRQGSLFDTNNSVYRIKSGALMSVCDSINEKYGRGCLHVAVRNNARDICGDGTKSNWIMDRKLLSPEYTTRVSDLPEVV